MTLQVIKAGYSTDGTSSRAATSSKSNFGEVLGIAASSFGGPAMMAVSDKSTATQAITLASVNGTIGGASLMTDASRSYSPYSTGGLSYGSTGSYYSGGAGLTKSTTGSTTTADVSAMLSESAVSQAEMIGLQAQMGNQSVQTNAISNVLNMKNMMELSVIRNMKTS